MVSLYDNEKHSSNSLGRLLTPVDTYGYKWTIEGNGKCIMQCTALM